jgi:hypothetical protein
MWVYQSQWMYRYKIPPIPIYETKWMRKHGVFLPIPAPRWLAEFIWPPKRRRGDNNSDIPF